MEADGGERGYVYFHDPSCHRDFSGTIFLIFKIFNNFLIFCLIGMTFCMCIHILDRNVLKFQKCLREVTKGC